MLLPLMTDVDVAFATHFSVTKVYFVTTQNNWATFVFFASLHLRL